MKEKLRETVINILTDIVLYQIPVQVRMEDHILTLNSDAMYGPKYLGFYNYVQNEKNVDPELNKVPGVFIIYNINGINICQLSIPKIEKITKIEISDKFIKINSVIIFYNLKNSNSK